MKALRRCSSSAVKGPVRLLSTCVTPIRITSYNVCYTKLLRVYQTAIDVLEKSVPSRRILVLRRDPDRNEPTVAARESSHSGRRR